WHEPAEQRLEIVEEPPLALVDPDERVATRGDVGDPGCDVALSDLVRHLVRDVEDGERRQRRGDGVRNLDARQTSSLGRRKWTSSAATVTSSDPSYPNEASRATTSWTMSSGVDAPAVRPTVSCPSRIPGSTSVSSSTSAASAPASRATSTSRWAFELVSDPITRMSDASSPR